MNTTPAVSYRYSYDEFADHIKAMRMVREWEYTSRFGHLGSEQSSRANSARVIEYFSDSYPDPKEAVHKADVFLSIYDFIGRNAALFAKKGLMEDLHTNLLSVDGALLRAVHYVFTVVDNPLMVHPKKVLALAKAYQDIGPIA